MRAMLNKVLMILVFSVRRARRNPATRWARIASAVAISRAKNAGGLAKDGRAFIFCPKFRREEEIDLKITVINTHGFRLVRFESLRS